MFGSLRFCSALCSVLFSSVLFCAAVLCSIISYSILFHSIQSYSTLAPGILFLLEQNGHFSFSVAPCQQ